MAKTIALIVSSIGLVLLIYGALSEAMTYVDLFNAVSPAYQGDYENATKNVGDFIADYTISCAYYALFAALIGAIPCIAHAQIRVMRG
jgi:hypothetical protein